MIDTYRSRRREKDYVEADLTVDGTDGPQRGHPAQGQLDAERR